MPSLKRKYRGGQIEEEKFYLFLFFLKEFLNREYNTYKKYILHNYNIYNVNYNFFCNYIKNTLQNIKLCNIKIITLQIYILQNLMQNI